MGLFKRTVDEDLQKEGGQAMLGRFFMFMGQL